MLITPLWLLNLTRKMIVLCLIIPRLVFQTRTTRKRKRAGLSITGTEWNKCLDLAPVYFDEGGRNYSSELKSFFLKFRSWLSTSRKKWTSVEERKKKRNFFVPISQQQIQVLPSVTQFHNFDNVVNFFIMVQCMCAPFPQKWYQVLLQGYNIFAPC